MAIPKKVNKELSYNSGIPLLFLLYIQKKTLYRYVYTHLHSSIIHNKQNVEAAQGSINK